MKVPSRYDDGYVIPVGTPSPRIETRGLMSLETILTEIDSLPIEHRFQLVQAFWDRLADQGHEPKLPEDMKAEIDRRLSAHDANPEAAAMGLEFGGSVKVDAKSWPTRSCHLTSRPSNPRSSSKVQR